MICLFAAGGCCCRMVCYVGDVCLLAGYVGLMFVVGCRLLWFLLFSW